MIMPFVGKFPITQKFGVKVTYMRAGYHTGTDFGLPIGTPLVASISGKVIKAAPWQIGGYGREIQIQGKDGIIAQYGHCSEIFVKVGLEVTQGMTIGKSGNTGFFISSKPLTDPTRGAHLHYGVMKNKQWIDPMNFINQMTLPKTEPAKDIFEPVKKVVITDENEFSQYTIKRGDTLSKICMVQLGNASLWQAVFEANRDVLNSANELYPGQVLKIPNSLKSNANSN